MTAEQIILWTGSMMLKAKESDVSCRDLGAGCDPMDFRRPIHHSVEIWYPDQMGTTTDFIVLSSLFCILIP